MTTALSSGFLMTIVPDTAYAVPPGPHRILTSTSAVSYSTTVGGVYTALTTPNAEPGVLLETGFIKNTSGVDALVVAKKVTRLNTYAGLVAQSNPYAFYRLNEKAGNVLYDAIGLNNLAKGAAVVLNQPGPLGDGSTAILLDGTINSVSSTSSGISPWTGATAISFEAWVYNAAWAAGHEMVISLGGLGHYMSVEAGKLYMSLHISGTQRTNFAIAPILSANTWYHIAVVWSTGEALTLYVNGARITNVNDGTVRAGSLTASTNINLGAFNGTSLFYSGIMDDVALYLRKLTASEIISHYSARNVK